MGIDLGENSISVAVSCDSTSVRPYSVYPLCFCSDGNPVRFDILLHEDDLSLPECCSYPFISSRNWTRDKRVGYEFAATFFRRVVRRFQQFEQHLPNDVAAVVSIPDSLTAREKSHLVSVLRIADVNVSRFVTRSAARAEFYARWWPDSHETVWLLDLGDCGSVSSVFEFQEGGYRQVVSKFDEQISSYILYGRIARE